MTSGNMEWHCFVRPNLAVVSECNVSLFCRASDHVLNSLYSYSLSCVTSFEIQAIVQADRMELLSAVCVGFGQRSDQTG